MQASRPRSPSKSFKIFFLRGLVVLLPSVLTLWLLVAVYRFLDNSIAAPINGWVRWAIVELDRQVPLLPSAFDPTPSEVQAEVAALAGTKRQVTAEQATQILRARDFRGWWEEKWYLNLVGLVIAIVGVWLAGRLVGGIIGRSLYRRLEQVLTSVPVIKHVYPHVKQVVDFILSDERPIKFNRVVAVQYPRPGIWSIGLVTGDGLKAVRGLAGDSVTVFIPSSPTPFTGYTMTVPRKDAVELPMTIDEALRYLVTAGVLAPGREPTAPAASPPLPLPASSENEPCKSTSPVGT